ncbi:MAG: GNAT family N-acetyltransferase [Planctomycetaceae bacterium]|nr:GNAT family N-acetyltransferase [Planctomycetaceae bacterium]
MAQLREPAIRTALPAERLTAVTFVLADIPEAETHAQQLLATQPNDAWQGLLVAIGKSGDLQGALWLQDLGGSAAMIWPPRLSAGIAENVAESLVAAALQLAERRDLQIVQALLNGDAQADTELLLRHEFRRLDDLAYLACVIDERHAAPWESSLTLTPVAENDEARLVAVVDATYQATLDLPELNNLRTAAEVLAEYRAAPQYDPRLWFLARHEQTDVGCLLLNDHTSLDQVELVYFGLIAQARGQRWGQELVRFAQQQAGKLGRRQLLLAVSAGNRPALNAYAATGFFAWQQRRTLVKFLRDKNSQAVSKS